MATAGLGYRELQATTEGNEVAWIIADLGRSYPWCEEGKNPRSANEHKSRFKLGHEPEAAHGPKRFLHQALGLGLDSLSLGANRLRCTSVDCALKEAEEYVVCVLWVRNWPSHALTLCNAARVLVQKITKLRLRRSAYVAH